MSDFSLEFSDEELPDVDAEIPEEELPEAIFCKYPGCNEQLVYMGRGRKPSYCSDHKGGKAVTSRNTNVQSRIKGTNEQLAAQASEVLAKSNSLAALALMAFGTPVTAATIAEHNEEFRDNAYQALLLDPKLCQKILATGGKTAGVALFLAYGQMAMFVIPVAMTEIKEKREARRKEMENAVGEDYSGS